MKIDTALILCAGYGKRLNPITLSKPKPLIEIKNKTLLYRTIELVLSLGIKKIKLNTFYLPDQIFNFVRNSEFKRNIEVINDGDEILDTGGGIKNMTKYSKKKDFLVFNPDTIWGKNYKNSIAEMIKFYEKKKLNNLLLVVNKKNSFEKKLKGDFNLKNSKVTREINNQYIYTGMQILNKNLIDSVEYNKFSINKIWDNQIKNNNLNGFESHEKFIHLTDIKIYNKIIKKLTNL
tara:strand:+ start:627 stop:1328 length:702 start_codon:yes stop_codon:yes gene_type:complete